MLLHYCGMHAWHTFTVTGGLYIGRQQLDCAIVAFTPVQGSKLLKMKLWQCEAILSHAHFLLLSNSTFPKLGVCACTKAHLQFLSTFTLSKTFLPMFVLGGLFYRCSKRPFCILAVPIIYLYILYITLLWYFATCTVYSMYLMKNTL